jgi:hypothetical protein
VRHRRDEQGIGHDELVRATLSVFGISRRGAKVVDRVEQMMAWAVSLGRLRLHDGLYLAT